MLKSKSNDEQNMVASSFKEVREDADGFDKARELVEGLLFVLENEDKGNEHEQ